MDIHAACIAACRSGRFETGQGTCALICMQFLGNPRKRGCGSALQVHGQFVNAILSAASAPDGLAQGHTEEASVRRETSK